MMFRSLPGVLSGVLLASVSSAGAVHLEEHAEGPIRAPGRDTSSLSNLTPSKSVSLSYGLGKSHTANVVVHLPHGGVMLEDIEGAHKVECVDDAIEVSFNSPAAFKRSMEEWSRAEQLVMVTNHKEDCNSEGERGFHVASSPQWDEDTLTVRANKQKRDIPDLADTIEVAFSQEARFRHDKEYDDKKTFNQPEITMNGEWGLPPNEHILYEPPSFNATADRFEVKDNVTISGYLLYHVANNSLESLYFDVEAAFEANMDFTFDFSGPFDHDFIFAPGFLQFAPIQIPLILKLGPSLRLGFGLDVGSNKATEVRTCTSVLMSCGRIHIDAIDGNKSSSTGWDPAYETTLHAKNGTGATVHASPFLDVSGEFALNLLSGAMDLSSGFTYEPKWIHELTSVPLKPSFGKGGKAPAQNPDLTSCASGQQLRKAFQYSIKAFVTEWWHKTLYTSAEEDPTEECYTEE